VDEHQQAYREIMSLRKTTNALDTQLTDLLNMLSETRQQIVSVPSTTFAKPPKTVSYTELLSYASKISKFSRPPNPIAFRKFANAVLPQSLPPAQQSGAATAGGVKTAEGSAKLPLGLLEEDLPHLDPSSQMPFTPWPSEEVMKQGALAMLGPFGVPEDMVPEAEKRAAEAAEEARRKEEEGKAANGKKEEQKDAERLKRMSIAPQAPQREKQPAISLISLDLYEPPEED
jgi:hypothetical protein